MSYIVPMNKPVCQNCYFRVGRYCGIIESTEQIPIKNRCPLIEISDEDVERTTKEDNA